MRSVDIVLHHLILKSHLEGISYSQEWLQYVYEYVSIVLSQTLKKVNLSLKTLTFVIYARYVQGLRLYFESNYMNISFFFNYYY